MNENDNQPIIGLPGNVDQTWVRENMSRPAVETPAVEAPAVEAPAVEAPVVEAPAVEAPAVETPAVETPAVEAPAVETPVVETPAVETPAVEAPAVEAPAVEAPAVETPAVEAPVVETPAVETPAVETPAVETPAVEAPAVEAPAVETELVIPEGINMPFLLAIVQAQSCLNAIQPLNLDGFDEYSNLVTSLLAGGSTITEEQINNLNEKTREMQENGKRALIRQFDQSITKPSKLLEKIYILEHQLQDALNKYPASLRGGANIKVSHLLTSVNDFVARVEAEDFTCFQNIESIYEGLAGKKDAHGVVIGGFQNILNDYNENLKNTLLANSEYLLKTFCYAIPVKSDDETHITFASVLKLINEIQNSTEINLEQLATLQESIQKITADLTYGDNPFAKVDETGRLVPTMNPKDLAKLQGSSAITTDADGNFVINSETSLYEMFSMLTQMELTDEEKEKTYVSLLQELEKRKKNLHHPWGDRFNLLRSKKGKIEARQRALTIEKLSAGTLLLGNTYNERIMNGMNEQITDLIQHITATRPNSEVSKEIAKLIYSSAFIKANDVTKAASAGNIRTANEAFASTPFYDTTAKKYRTTIKSSLTALKNAYKGVLAGKRVTEIFKAYDDRVTRLVSGTRIILPTALVELQNAIETANTPRR